MIRDAHSILCLAATVLGSAIALAQSPPERDGRAAVAQLQKALVDVIAQVEPSVVAISRTAPEAQANIPAPAFDEFADLRARALEAQAETVAAGVIIDPAGLVLTEFLAVREGDLHIVTLTSGESYPAEVKAADPRSGLAVLAIQKTGLPASRAQRGDNSATENETARPPSFPAVQFGDADNLGKGQFVVAIGNPYAIRSDGEPTASWGIVANLARRAPPGTNLNDAPGATSDYRTSLHHLGTLIQTDARLGWGAGGGALVNFDGELVGLTITAAAIAGHEQPAGYAIPINATFRRIIDTLKDGREVEYGLLGLALANSDALDADDIAPRVIVQYTFAGGPGDRAGLKPNDVIFGIDGKPVRNVEEAQLAIGLSPPSTKITIDYGRGGNRTSTTVSLAKLAVSGKKIVSNRLPAWRGIRVDYATALESTELAQAIASDALDPAGCVLVAEVEEGSEAAGAGIRKGMFIHHVGAERVTTPAEFYQAVKGAGDISDLRLTQPIQTANGPAANDKIPDSRPPQP